jgi:hypothetical protein
MRKIIQALAVTVMGLGLVVAIAGCGEKLATQNVNMDDGKMNGDKMGTSKMDGDKMGTSKMDGDKMNPK